MSKQKEVAGRLETAMTVVALVVLVALFIIAGWLAIKAFRAVWPDNLFDGSDIPYSTYCVRYKKIVKAEPLYEDNGPHEDEAYRITFEDGSVGLLDNGNAPTGEICTQKKWLPDAEGDKRGLHQL